MSQDGHNTEAVLAAAFGQQAYDAGLPQPAAPAQPAVAVDEQVPNLFVNLDDNGTPAPAATTPAVQPAAPVHDAVAEMRERLATAEREAAYMRGQLEARTAAQPAQPQAQPQQPAQDIYNPAQDALTPDELVAYKDALPVVEKLARQAAFRAQQSLQGRMEELASTNAALQARLETVQGQATRADEVALMHTVRSMVPDADKITTTPEWKRYLAGRAPFSGGRAVRDVLDYAVQTRDAETITEHLMAFRASHNIATPPVQAPAPGRSAAPAAVGLDVPQRRVGISAGALDEAMSKVQAGTLSKDAYDKMLAQAYALAASGSELVQ